MVSTVISDIKASRIKDFWYLLKPRVMYLVTFTGMAGLLIAPGSIHPFIALIAIICIALGAGAAGAINMWYDSDIDLIMERTKSRPIPSGQISRQVALEFGVILSIVSVFVMSLATNYVSASLLAISILFYTLIYTMWLKRSTPQNIVIGGIAGSFPPMIGWSVVTGSVSFESFILFLIIFIWTPPHFWSLALLNTKEYEKAKLPMLPITHGHSVTRIHILVYSIVLFIVSIVPGIFLKHYLIYECIAIVLGINFLRYALILCKAKSKDSYKNLFTYSILYLFVLFSAIIASALL